MLYIYIILLKFFFNQAPTLREGSPMSKRKDSRGKNRRGESRKDAADKPSQPQKGTGEGETRETAPTDHQDPDEEPWQRQFPR